MADLSACHAYLLSNRNFIEGLIFGPDTETLSQSHVSRRHAVARLVHQGF